MNDYVLESGEVRIIDPHHVIRAGNITVAVVRCGPGCPRSHFVADAPRPFGGTVDPQ